jgi:3-oxoacyl-[acyl-carrier protein] reductase
MQLAGRVAVVTGAGRGIGAAAAAKFVSLGARVAAIDLSLDDLSRTIRDAGWSQSQARAYSCDVSDEAAVGETFARIAADFGALDILFNNAGITRDALLLKVDDGKVVRRMSLEQWQRVIDVNLTGVFLCGREAATHMVQFAKGGVLINVSSISRVGNVGQTNYTAAKAGVAAMTVVWAKELARYGIRAGSIAPGMTRTEMTASMKPEALENLARAIPLRRCAEVEEIVHAAVFIAENEYFSGRCIEVDGGLRF